MSKMHVEISDITTSGEGVAKTKDRVLFVDGALPGEKAEVLVVERKKNYSKGKLLRVIKESPQRCVPPCKYYNECGGCTMQHATVDLGRKIKQERVYQSIKRIGGFSNPLVHPCESSPQPYGYRNKITLPLLFTNGEKQTGFFKKRSHEIVGVETCLLHVSFADAIYSKIRNLLLNSKVTFYDEKRKQGELQHLVIRSSDKKKKVLIGLIGLKQPSKALRTLAAEFMKIKGVKGVVYGKKKRASNSIYPDRTFLLEGADMLTETIVGVNVKVSILSFFQVNKGCAEKLYTKAYQLADLEKGARVLDAYCGIGSFAIYLAKQGLDVTGVESYHPAVLDAKANAERNGVNADFICAEVENYPFGVNSYDAVFINPPRKGVDESVIEAIVKASPKKIIYTSCDPASLARDLKLFAQNGYQFKEAFPFDMFPQTTHVETIALLVRN